MKKKLLTLAVIFSICSLSTANITSITPATSWAAGIDSLDIFYAADFSTDNGYAELNVSNPNAASGTRAVFIAKNNFTAGTYSYSVDSMFTSYYSQYNYFNVYLLNDNTMVPLTAELGTGMEPLGAELVSNTVAPPSTDGETWYTHDVEFTITDTQADNYSYIGFQLIGSKADDTQVLAYDNFSVNVPEPMTIVLLGIGSVFMLKPGRTPK